jgi:hypothetical protein
MLFKEIIAVYCGNNMNTINKFYKNAELLDVKAGGTYNYRSAMNG